MTTRSLGEVARFVNGAAFKPTDWTDQGLPIIRIQNLTGTGQNYNYTTREVKPELVVRPNDLLVSWSATLDVYRWAGPTGVLNQHIFKVLPNQGVDADYLYFALKDALAELSSKTHGSTMKHVVRGDFESTRIRLPSVHEQRRIVDMLTRAEGIVRLRREAAAKAAELIPALFIHHFGDPATNPMGWPVVPLGTVAAVQGGLQVTRARNEHPLERPYLRVANVYRDRLDLDEIKSIRLTEAELQRTRLQAGDLLFVEGHGNPAEVGRVAVWDDSIEDCTHQNHLIRARPDRARLLPEFACTLLNSQGGRQSLLRSGKTTSGLSTISTQNVKDAVVFLPPLAQQAAFVQRLEDVASIQRQQITALAKAQSTFDALLAQAFDR